MSCILGILLLLYTWSNIKSGTADLLGLLSWRSLGGDNDLSDAEVTRENSGCLFWFAILSQVLVGIGLIVYGDKLERALGIELPWSLWSQLRSGVSYLLR